MIQPDTHDKICHRANLKKMDKQNFTLKIQHRTQFLTLTAKCPYKMIRTILFIMAVLKACLQDVHLKREKSILSCRDKRGKFPQFSGFLQAMEMANDGCLTHFYLNSKSYWTEQNNESSQTRKDQLPRSWIQYQGKSPIYRALVRQLIICQTDLYLETS